MIWKHTLWVAAAALSLAGCMSQGDTKASDAAMAQFYQQVAAKDYGGIWDASAPGFQSSTPRDIFGGMMQRIDRKLGVCQPPVKQFNFHINVGTDGTTISQGWQRTCANGPLAEQVVVLIAGGKAKILGYNAQSPLLLTD